MTNLQYNKSDRLYYKKFKYKLAFYSPLGNILRRAPWTDLKTVIDAYRSNPSCINKDYPETRSSDIWKKLEGDNIVPYNLRYIISRFNPSHNEMKDGEKVYNFLSSEKDCKVRVEFNQVGIFSNNREPLLNLGKSLKTFYACNFFEPRHDLQKADTLYHNFADKYKYKVTVGEVYDSSLGDYLEANNNTVVRAGAVAIENIKARNTGNYSSYYFYVRDDKILNLISMFGFKIDRLEELLPK